MLQTTNVYIVYLHINFNCCRFVTLCYNYQLISLIIGYIVIIFILQGRKDIAAPDEPNPIYKNPEITPPVFFFWLQNIRECILFLVDIISKNATELCNFAKNSIE